jgi:hypothetical protein
MPANSKLPVSDDAVRRAAKRQRLLARKSRRRISCDNLGGWMIIDPDINAVVWGSHFELSNDNVMELLSGR